MAIEKFNKNMAIIAALDDEPNDVGGMTSAELKNKFDEGGKAIQSYMNETLIPALENLGVETAVLLPENAAGFKYIRLNADKVLEVSTDGNVWQATGSSGHLIIGPDGQALPQRSRMQFMNGTVTDENGVTVITGVKGDKGDVGPQGEQGVQGPTGPQGPAGQSAYTAAQSAGYAGTEEQFNSDLAAIGSKIDVNMKGAANGVASLGSDGKVPGTQLPSLDYIPTSQKGAAGGVASLGSDGKVPGAQLPSLDYVPTSQKGAANGVASLGADGKVPSAQLPETGGEAYTATLTTSGWTKSGGRYSQIVNVTGVTASTPVVLVDVALSGADIDADAASLEAWGIVSANNVAQGNGTLTFYALSVPSVNIPVNVGVC